VRINFYLTASKIKNEKAIKILITVSVFNYISKNIQPVKQQNGSIRIMRFVNTVFILLCLLRIVGGFIPSLEAKETKGVLILYSQDKWHPGHQLTEQGMRDAFGSNTAFEVQLYAEYLDISQFFGSEQLTAMADFLGKKYAGTTIDVIITVYPAASDFVIKTEGKLFPGVPIVACELTRDYAQELEVSAARNFVTGTIIEGDNVTDLLNEALKMKPNTKNFALIAGTAPNDIYGEKIFRIALEPFAKRIGLIDLTRLSMQETLLRVGSLPADTVVLYETIFKDGSGRLFVPREALSLIAQAANSPVFGLYESYMGYGIVGGKLVSLENHGKEAARLSLRIMGGESPAAIPLNGEIEYANLYDWRELQRWHIPQSAVPEGGVVLFRNPSIWEQYSKTVIFGLFLFTAEGLLIILLVINLRRRLKAERDLSQSKHDLQGLTARLIETQEEELSHLSREIHDDLTQRLAGLAIEAGILEQQLKNLQVPAAQGINDMKVKLIDVSEDLHNLSRQLHPAILDDLGLAEAVKSECMVFSKRTGIALSFAPDKVPGSIPKDIALCLYRVIQEALKNVEKHSKSARAQIALQGLSNGVRLLIQDFGAGFDPNARRNKAGVGLSSIKERVGLINGTMSVTSELERGTEIEVFVPLEGKI
jgi:signal transduction histidine kinase